MYIIVFNVQVAGNEGIEMALKDPSSYVLKPQREGGGKSSIFTYLVTC